MQSKAIEPVRTKMESLRLICDREIQIQLREMDSFTLSYSKSLDSIKARLEETVHNQEKLGKLKSSLREADDEFVKVLAVKTRKEAKQMATKELISTTRARIQELERTVQIQRAKRDEYATIMSKQSLAEETKNQDTHKREIQDALLWYNRVLGFNIEGGQGVKFTFSNINMKNPHEEYSFTMRYEKDVYTLLACNPQLNDTKQLIHELNKTNGLFKFVRTMRLKFQEAASLGLLPQFTILHQESATISASAPDLSVSTDGSESQRKTSKYPDEVKRNSKKGSYGRGAKQAMTSPVSVRQSPRFKPKK